MVLRKCVLAITWLGQVRLKRVKRIKDYKKSRVSQSTNRIGQIIIFTLTHLITLIIQTVCGECGMKLSDPSRFNNLLRHKREQHTIAKNHKCSTCEISFSRKDALDNHVNCNHATDPIIYACRIWGFETKILMGINPTSANNIELLV